MHTLGCIYGFCPNTNIGAIFLLETCHHAKVVFRQGCFLTRSFSNKVVFRQGRFPIRSLYLHDLQEGAEIQTCQYFYKVREFPKFVSSLPYIYIRNPNPKYENSF